MDEKGVGVGWLEPREQAAHLLGGRVVRDANRLGDLFLADIRAYREAWLSRLRVMAMFPLWHRETGALAEAFVALGFQAVVTCVALGSPRRTMELSAICQLRVILSLGLCAGVAKTNCPPPGLPASGMQAGRRSFGHLRASSWSATCPPGFQCPYTASGTYLIALSLLPCCVWLTRGHYRT